MKIGKTSRATLKKSSNFPTSSRLGSSSSEESLSKAENRNSSALYASSFLIVLGNALVAFSPAPALMKELGTASATKVLSTLASTAAVLQIIFAPMIGSLMDSVGRKPVFLIALLSLIAVNSAVAVNPTIPFISAAKVVGSFCVGIFFLTTQTILSDITSAQPEKLSSAMGIQLSLTSLGFLCGAVGAGQLAGKGLRVPYRTSAIVIGLGAIISATLLGETLLPSKRVDRTEVKRFRSPFASFKLFRYKELRVLVFLLLLSTMPTFMGEVFQVFAKAEWNLEAKNYASFVALFGVIGILGNVVGSVLVRKLGIKTFTAMATLSSLCVPIGAATFQFRGTVIGAFIGFLSSAQSLAIGAALVSEGSKLGIPQGRLAGDRSSLYALIKVIAPVWYSLLYVQGKKLTGLNFLPFVFNITIALIAFSLSMVCL